MALIKHVIINTHPGIHIKNHYRIVFYADDDEAQQDFMITCRKEHFFLQISPQFASIDRQHKIFATVNTGGNMRPLQALPQTPGLAVDPLNPLYETRLNPGGNQIIIEVIADAYPQVKAKSVVQIEHEKMTIMAFLLK